MAIYAKVTRVMTTDFAEVSILDGIDGEPIDDTTYIAEFEGKKDNVRRDDIVEVVTAENRIMNESRIAYILPVVGAVLGFLFTGGKATGERLLAAFLLALMLFIVAWVMNRRSRMLKYRKYRVKKIIKTSEHFL
ncbi:MAG: SoxR reducing system RseC family protein [Firmicutes bacterium]|jgi:positive regulator of sigma E activity|nr:SoxR reducing system RseC family protein [Bacillota bacterium]